ncbi:hypothetical protein GCM10011332_20950 [Terasakiella brassicae]|uniref:Uncharacterized protein n=1 Tax=Terasakiella brassicae TaxID=1634917 RepID=A0A917FE27_9PROT|nr:phosphatidylinositol-specific phospholipase C/glycerophosphodiester phosphodiesterase family protein [Terasakiella brassicae]GGF66657.1 hypothetical protein GCM10011332_20950 [Terasakiella brassicae]
MEYIAHRLNTVAQLKKSPTCFGVEVDIRSDRGKLIIHHDPFCEGEFFEDWISAYKHGTLILNVKEEGLEQKLLDIMSLHNITNFFFLDQSFPFLVKWAQMDEKRCAVRVSEFETIETAMALAGKVEWVWVDCFTKFPLTPDEIVALKEAGFKLCLVSPELQGYNAEDGILQLFTTLGKHKTLVDAVCTKRPDLWAALDKG